MTKIFCKNCQNLMRGCWDSDPKRCLATRAENKSIDYVDGTEFNWTSYAECYMKNGIGECTDFVEQPQIPSTRIRQAINKYLRKSS